MFIAPVVTMTFSCRRMLAVTFQTSSCLSAAETSDSMSEFQRANLGGAPLSNLSSWGSRILLVVVAALAFALSTFAVGLGPNRNAEAQVPDFRNDGTGAFRVMCGFSHTSADDPIVSPGQPGATHQHLFFGNESTDAFSTASTLRANTESTCHGGALNASAYWVPAMYKGNGNAIVPDQTHVYYKSGTVDPKTVQLFPEGLSIIAGDPNARFDQPSNIVRWLCTPDASESSNRVAQATMPRCPQGQFLQASVIFPQCWNGRDLTSSTAAHMAYPTGGTCPASHPRPVPRINLNFLWRIGPEGMAGWRLSSDRAGAPAGQSLHADWIDGWNRNVMATWVKNCVRAERNCRLGELGNGTTLSRYRLGDGAFGTPLPGYGGTTVAGAPPRAKPVGRLTQSQVTAGGIFARGFALDPNDTRAVDVSITVDGKRAWKGPADVHRAHLNNLRFANYGSSHGFRTFIPLSSGTHTICGVATDLTGATKRLGCHQVSINANPTGIFDGVIANPSGFGFFGWAYDADATGTTTVKITVDGHVATYAAASNYRGSLARNQPGIGTNRGFRGRVDVSPGTHSVCATALNQNSGSDTFLGCHLVSV